MSFSLFSCAKDATYENYFDSKSYKSNYDAWKSENLQNYTFTITSSHSSASAVMYKVIVEVRNNEVVSKEYPIPESEQRRQEEYLNNIKQNPLFGETNSIDDVFDYIFKRYMDMVENPTPITSYDSGTGIMSEYYYDAVLCNVKYDSKYHYPTYIEFETRYKELDKTDRVGFSSSSSYHITDFKILSDEQ